MTSTLAMTEDQLMEAIRAMCKMYGLRVFHVHDSRRSWGPGFPDLVIVGRRVIYRECKSDSRDAHVTPDQRAWLLALGRAGQDAQTWYPRDWRDGIIAAQLAAIR